MHLDYSVSDDDLYITPASVNFHHHHDSLPASHDASLPPDAISENASKLATRCVSPHPGRKTSPGKASKSITALPEGYRPARPHHSSLSSARSSFSNWLSNTMSTMTEISEQIVSAAE
uniref:Uncharacterized protein n=1 Tax=Romanomermis culicivorax TaxID=13658 RepID=A0A915L3D2_ROMCU